MRSSLAACLLLAFLASCAAPQFQLLASYGRTSADGNADIVSGTPPAPGQGARANSHNSLDDLGLDQSESTPALRADFKWGVPHLTLSTMSTGWEGSGTLNVAFGDISATTDVDTQFDLALHRLVLTFDVLPTDAFELGLGFGITAIDVEGSVTDPASSVRESFDEVLPVPVLALRAATRIWRFDCELLIDGLTANVDGDSATFLETDLGVRYAIWGEPGSLCGALAAGWRQVDLAAEYDDGADAVDLDMSFSGPYFGLQVGL